MKLLAGRGIRDQEDIERLLDACSITRIADAEAIFDRYYPAEPMNHLARSLLVARFHAIS